MRELATTLFRPATRPCRHRSLYAAAAALAAASLFLPATAFGIVPARYSARASGGMPRAVAKRASGAATAAASSQTGPRIELFFKSDTELRERVRLLSAEGFAAFSLVNKNNDDRMLEWLDACLAEAPDASVCVHYSLKYNKNKAGADASFGLFSAHLKALDTRGYGKRAEVLLISGSGPKTPLDTVACLEKLARERSAEEGLTKVGVAFNPYYEDKTQAELERSRLRKKLATRQVHTVWLQFGSDTALLERSLQWLTSELEEEVRPRRVVGSLFLPTKQLIAQQRFRPWNGVFLSSEYLSGPESAEAITSELLRIYAHFGVEILVEAPGVRVTKDVALLRSLLADVPAPAATLASAAAEAEGMVQGGSKAPKRLRLSGGGETTSPSSPSSVPSHIASSAASPGAPAASASEALELVEGSATGVVLFGHHDLRLNDNPAYAAACSHGAVVPVFVWCPGEDGEFEPGRALQVYLEQAIKSLESELQAKGLRLILRCGTSTPEALLALCKEVKASAVFFNRDVTPAGCRKASNLQSLLSQHLVSCCESRGTALLYEPEAVPVKTGFNGGHWGTLMPFLRSTNSQKSVQTGCIK